MFTEAYLESNRISIMNLFSLQLSHILKTYLIRSNFFLKFDIMQWNDIITKKNEQKRLLYCIAFCSVNKYAYWIELLFTLKMII